MSISLNQGAALPNSNLDNAVAALATESLGYVYGELQVVQNTGQLVKLINTDAPLDKPFSVKVSRTPIPNMYQSVGKGTVPIGKQSPNASGVHVFAEVACTGSVSPVDEPELLFPMTARIELKVPLDGDMDNVVAGRLIFLAIAALSEHVGGLRVTDVMRGVLVAG